MPADLFDISFKIVGTGGALIAAFKAIAEFRENRQQKEKELRWKNANSARVLINEMMGDTLAKYSTIMIDWDGREYKYADEVYVVALNDILNSLRIINLNFTDQEVFIRDCFDHLLYYVETIEQSIRNELFNFKDISFPMDYFVATLIKRGIKNPLIVFMNEYGYNNSINFFNRYSNWRN